METWADKLSRQIEQKLIQYNIDRRIKFIYEFTGKEDFVALDKAKETLEKRGFLLGPLCGDYPVAFASKVLNNELVYIAKWRNIDPSEYYRLSGVLLSDDFRSGAVYLVEFFE